MGPRTRRTAQGKSREPRAGNHLTASKNIPTLYTRHASTKTSTVPPRLTCRHDCGARYSSTRTTQHAHITRAEKTHTQHPGAGVRPATLATRTIFRPRALHTPRRRTHHTWCSSVSPCAPLAAPSLVRLNNPRIPIADTPFTHHPLSSRRHSPARPRLGGGAVGIPQVHDTTLSDT